jgi:hypothetical protein
MSSTNGKEDIIERVRKLLALAQNEGATEHEAALAAEKAQAMLAAHNLSLSDVHEDKDEGTKIEMDREVMTDPMPWARPLRSAVADLYFCSYVFNVVKQPDPKRTYDGYRAYDRHWYIGERHNILVAQMMSDYLVKTGRRLAYQASKEHYGREVASFITSFLNAFAGRMCQRIADRKAASMARATPVEGGTQLPALRSLYEQSQDLRKQFIEQEVPGVKPHNRSLLSRSHAGHAAGRKAADSVSLDAQVGHSKQGKLK